VARRAYLAVGQIYLLDNPLLCEPLIAEHIKPRLLGHFGTVPGLNLVWAHANRQIVRRDLDAVFSAGPGHGGTGPNACAWLEGTYSELYSHISQDASGMAAFFRQFSFPGSVPSHCAPETPDSFHKAANLVTRFAAARVRRDIRQSGPNRLLCHWRR
jgi:xylulose-5-phosphate/fructose-6-phosphate phosphoketolase